MKKARGTTHELLLFRIDPAKDQHAMNTISTTTPRQSPSDRHSDIYRQLIQLADSDHDRSYLRGLLAEHYRNLRLRAARHDRRRKGAC